MNFQAAKLFTTAKIGPLASEQVRIQNLSKHIITSLFFLQMIKDWINNHILHNKTSPAVAHLIITYDKLISH